jgi:hypothetical protein
MVAKIAHRLTYVHSNSALVEQKSILTLKDNPYIASENDLQIDW